MNQSEAVPHSFIVKIWLEGPDDEAGQPSWHGYITHVPGNERRYLKDLGEIIAFIGPYLDGYGARLPLCWRASNYLRHLMTRMGSKAKPPTSANPGG